MTVVALFALPAAQAVAAQPSYPDKPIRWISPFAAGGGSDLTTRAVALKLSELLKQTVVVDNRVGASGNIGAEIATRAPADGYTLVTMTVSIVTNHAVSSKPPFDILQDFSHVTQLTAQPYVLITHPSIKANSVKEFIALAKSRPGTLNYGSSGIATLQHLAGALFGATTQTDLVHIPYKGGGPALTAVVAGEVDFVVQSPGLAFPNIRAGKLKVLVVAGSKRLPLASDAPTAEEVGLPEFKSRASTGFMAPARTPRPIIDRLNGEITRYLNTPEARKYFADAGYDLIPGPPEEFTRYQLDELERWSAVAKAAKIQVE